MSTAVVGFCDVIQAHNQTTAVWSRRKTEVDFFQRFRNLNAFHLLEFFHVFLSLSCLSCLVTEAADKIFKFVDFFLLLFVSGNQGFKLNLANLLIVRKVSRIAFEVAVEKLVDLVDCNIKKIAVMADK